ncbi:MAG TPA: Flp family type IVb pilin [Candidatus Angelobacter sp.]|nr:Flp family type IVb pilin [Candidatus Angelobacter sp.]
MTAITRILASIHKDESGQDLIEYALVVALIALGTTAGMTAVATGINSAFTALSTIIGKYIS